VNTDAPVWLLDVDGVINTSNRSALNSDWTKMSSGGACANGTEYLINWSPYLIDRIRTIHAEGLAEIRWSTTWVTDTASLEQLLRLPKFPLGFEMEPYPSGRRLQSEWHELVRVRKANAARDVIRSGRRLVWTDDQIIMGAHAGSALLYEIPAFTGVEIHPGQALIISPDHRVGLQPSEVDRIEEFCLGGGDV